MARCGHLGLVLLAVPIFATACKSWVQIENGELTPEMIPYAKKVEGQYQGVFSDIPTGLNIQVADREAILSPNTDLAGPGCGSRVGRLLRAAVRTAKDGGQIAEAVYEFHPGACLEAIAGRELYLKFAKRDSKRVSASILERTEQELDCSDPAHFGRCVHRTRVYYLSGTFTRQEAN